MGRRKGGKRVHPSKEKVMCPSCDSNGDVLLAHKDCPRCKGKGYSPEGHSGAIEIFIEEVREGKELTTAECYCRKGLYIPQIYLNALGEAIKNVKKDTCSIKFLNDALAHNKEIYENEIKEAKKEGHLKSFKELLDKKLKTKKIDKAVYDWSMKNMTEALK